MNEKSNFAWEAADRFCDNAITAIHKIESETKGHGEGLPGIPVAALDLLDVESFKEAHEKLVKAVVDFREHVAAQRMALYERRDHP